MSPRLTKIVQSSAANAVFHVAELVALIIEDFTSSELSKAARLSKAAAVECERLLSRSPSITDLVDEDERLAKLTKALRTRQGKAESLELSWLANGLPTVETVCNLFKKSDNVTRLTLTSKLPPEVLQSKQQSLTTSPSDADLHSGALVAVRGPFFYLSDQLSSLTISFSQFDRCDTNDLLQVVRSCRELRHLQLFDLHLNGLVQEIEPPSYNLTSLALQMINPLNENATLRWFLRDSDPIDTLLSLTIDLPATASCQELLERLPRLNHLTLHVVPGSDTDFHRILSSAALPGLLRLELIMENADWLFSPHSPADVEERVSKAINELDEASRAKVTFEVVGLWVEEGFSAGENDVSESDEEEEDEASFVGSGARKLGL